jgi:hypothetical protein
MFNFTKNIMDILQIFSKIVVFFSIILKILVIWMLFLENVTHLDLLSIYIYIFVLK